MKTRLTLLTVFAFLFPAAAFAQNDRIQSAAFGYIPSQLSLNISSLYELSLFDNNMGTPRSAAMGGAFTSLGADFSSMHINPAGLGMYRSASEIGISSSIFINGAKNKWRDESWRGSRTSAALNSIGFVINGYEGSGNLTSVTMGFGYNRLADFNYNSRVELGALHNTGITEMFALQLRGIPQSDLQGDNIWNDDRITTREWGAVLGNWTNLIRPVAGPGYIYHVPGIDPDAATAQYVRTISKGNIGEYSFSTGMNFRNKFYLGFTVGMIDIYQKRDVNYSESYTDNNPDGSVSPAEYMNYNQNTLVTGNGFNMKAGFIYRPVPEFRIGATVHSPTFMTIETRYRSGMSVESTDVWNTAYTPTQRFTDKFITPTRLLAGASYTVAGRGIIAADYECTWYDGIRLWGNDYYPSETEAIKEMAKQDFAPGHTVRIGGEFMALPELALRAGYACSWDGPDRGIIFEFPVRKSSLSASFGMGYRFRSGVSLDLAYVYTGMKFTRYDMFYYENPYEDSGSGDDDPPAVKLTGFDLSRDRHNIMLSLNVRF